MKRQHLLWGIIYFDIWQFNFGIFIVQEFDICTPTYIRDATAHMAPLPWWPDGML